LKYFILCNLFYQIECALDSGEALKFMADIVLVPGAYHGGWYYSSILPQLRAAGHQVFTITLSGLNGPRDRQHPAINLDTHIDDLVSLIENERLNNVVLCGHSYGGMVIAGASDKLPGRIRTLLFLDALVPNNGDSVWSIFPSPMRDMFVEAAPDGLMTQNPPDTEARARPHPLATFLQPIRLTETAYSPANKVYAWCNANAGSPFEGTHDRLAADNEWSVHRLACGHDIMNEAPELALKLLLETAKLP
jgi:pimeloyl-ACP methyl ester carboxylesterase